VLFPTLAFGVFFLFVYFTAWSLDRENERRKLFLLLASWVFYAQWDWRFVALLIASAVLNWGVAALIARSDDAGRRKLLVGLGVAANLLILGAALMQSVYIGERWAQAGRPPPNRPLRWCSSPAPAPCRSTSRRTRASSPARA
jgi:D-alanyl-lipoteichoic acid acyltransferase DltB (MBOAT superfamily)